jgi:hypothetical protein
MGEGEALLLVKNACGGATPPIATGSIPARRGHVGGLVAVSRVARLHQGTLTYEAAEGALMARLALPVISGDGLFERQPEPGPPGTG